MMLAYIYNLKTWEKEGKVKGEVSLNHRKPCKRGGVGELRLGAIESRGK